MPHELSRFKACVTPSIPHRSNSPASARVSCDPSPFVPEWLQPFVARRGLRNGHVQTLLGNYLPRPKLNLPTTCETVEVDATDGSRVLCCGHFHPAPDVSSRLTLVLVHGLEGSAESRYMTGIAARGWNAGCNVVRMNMRNCGGTDHLTPTLYNSALSGDVGAVIDHYAHRFDLGRVALVGYSMGGNLVLKLAGEWGRRAPLCAVAAVCPSMDLAVSADALHQPSNRIYEWHFLRRLMQRYRRKAALFPGRYQVEGIGPVRSIREFDDKIVARYCGFRDADDYYFRAAAARVVDRIAVPTFVLNALDDPFIRLTEDTRARIAANPKIAFVETEHGGHCAYLCGLPGDDIHWAESAIMRFMFQYA